MAAEPRIASLVPSLTELLFDLGLGERVVARTGYCVHPRDGVSRVPKVGGTKTVNIRKLRQLAPTHVVVNVDENLRETVDEIARFVPEVIVTHPLRVTDNLALYRRFGDAFGVRAAAQAWCERLERALEHVAACEFAHERALYLVWKEPWMTVARDTYIADMLATVGWQAVAPHAIDAAARYPTLAWERLDASTFETMLLPSEPYHFAAQDVESLRTQRRFEGASVRLVDGEMVSWYGSRAVAGLEYLRRFRADAPGEESSAVARHRKTTR